MFGNVSNHGNSSNKEQVYTNISIAYDGYMGIINKVDISCGSSSIMNLLTHLYSDQRTTTMAS